MNFLIENIILQNILIKEAIIHLKMMKVNQKKLLMKHLSLYVSERKRTTKITIQAIQVCKISLLIVLWHTKDFTHTVNEENENFDFFTEQKQNSEMQRREHISKFLLKKLPAPRSYRMIGKLIQLTI